ncbi:hypothetical protein AAHB60_06735 [Pseudomonas aeruginosa]
MGAFEGFFGGVLSTARRGVARLSQEALNAFERDAWDLHRRSQHRHQQPRCHVALAGQVSEQLARIKAESGVGMSGFGRWAMDAQRGQPGDPGCVPGAEA